MRLTNGLCFLSLNLSVVWGLSACGSSGGDIFGAGSTSRSSSSSPMSSGGGAGGSASSAGPGTTASGAGTGGMPSCGNGLLEPGEQCDGPKLGGKTCVSILQGFAAGTLGCDANCAFDTSKCIKKPACGDGH